MKLQNIVVIALLLSSLSITAQTKLGTVDSDYIIGKMPQMKQVLERTKVYGTKLDSSYQVKIKEYQTKATAFKKIEKTLSNDDKQKKGGELFELEKGLNEFREKGAQMMQLRRDDFMRPLYKKVSTIISKIAKEKGYTQILTTSGNQFAYLDEKHDITQLVLDELGIKK